MVFSRRGCEQRNVHYDCVQSIHSASCQLSALHLLPALLYSFVSNVAASACARSGSSVVVWLFSKAQPWTNAVSTCETEHFIGVPRGCPEPVLASPRVLY